MQTLLSLYCTQSSHGRGGGGGRKKKNELELSNRCVNLQLSFERGERLGVFQSRREVVPEHWSSRLEGACTIASRFAGIVMIARDRETRLWWRVKSMGRVVQWDQFRHLLKGCSTNTVDERQKVEDNLQYDIYLQIRYIHFSFFWYPTRFHESSKTGIHLCWKASLASQKTTLVVRRNHKHDERWIHTGVACVMHSWKQKMWKQISLKIKITQNGQGI